MATKINFYNHVKELDRTMRGMQRILYVGTNCDMLKAPTLCSKSWRCIYTASRSVNFPDAFSLEDRQVRQITTKDAYDAAVAVSVLDHGNPMIIQFNGTQDACDGTEDFKAALIRNKNRRELQETLAKILKANLMVELVVVGYDPYNRDEISPEDLAVILADVGGDGPHASFYGVDPEQENHKYIREMEAAGMITVFSQDLGAAWEKLSLPALNEDAPGDVIPEAEDLKYTVYVNGEPKILSRQICNDFARYAMVLTAKEMSYSPIPRMMQPDYFYKFLRNSPNVPQWYGYVRRNGFAVQRAFEDELYKVAKNGLEENFETPIVLAGQTSTGKSIALTALAYRFFQERKYPVLFSNNDKYGVKFGSLDEDVGRALDNILKQIRDLGGRALVILDWSVYNIQRTDLIRRISDSCVNRGHNALFVVSAMRAENCGKRYRVIEAPEKLSENEKRNFKEIIIEKGSLRRNRVEHWMQDHSEEPGLLSMLYQLIYELRPQLEHGLRKEITNALKETGERVRGIKCSAQEEKLTHPLTEIARQLIKAGFVAPPAEDNPESLNEWHEAQKEEVIKSLQTFAEDLAIASLHKLRMPMTLAMKLLNIPDGVNCTAYVNAIFDAPWMYSVMDDERLSPGEYYVSFRSPTDARIYLNSIRLDAQSDQLEVVARIIGAIGEYQGTYYMEEIRFLERLVRVVGPNSEDPDVSDGWVRRCCSIDPDNQALGISSDWSPRYSPGAPKIIEALDRLRKKGIVEPQLIAQEITYIRECFATRDILSDSNDFLKNQNGALRDKIHWLEYAIQIAREVLEMVNYNDERSIGWQENLIDAIAVESIFSELRLEKFYESAEEQGLKIKRSVQLLSFEERRDKLLEIINAQPENSYPYTAFLDVFLYPYENENVAVDDQMLTCLADVLPVVDSAEFAVPAVEENEYYQNRRYRFFKVFDRVFSQTNRAEEYFQDLLKKGSPVGIYMKARAILRSAGVDYTQELTGSKAKVACKEALAILEDPQYASIVENHAASQYVRLHLIWLIYNTKPIFAQERQTTRMSNDSWKLLKRICDGFINNFYETQMNSLYMATACYIAALSCAQMGDYQGAVRFWNQVEETDIYASWRQKTWHILSDPDGNPLVFNGTFNYPRLTERRIYVREMRMNVLYRSLQAINKSSTSGDAPDLCVGTSFRGFNVSAIKRHEEGRCHHGV
ncbi:MULTISPECIES: hypothetical protein [unclassified Neglectibacter]|uniref:hypothetical protein n=1 Tax=unclassified Neglectibacter TaxID=2632164 RepID=UPI00136864A9|nr:MULTISPECIES: hypothetical protein [unclassified Neglectibacter]